MLPVDVINALAGIDRSRKSPNQSLAPDDVLNLSVKPHLEFQHAILREKLSLSCRILHIGKVGKHINQFFSSIFAEIISFVIADTSIIYVLRLVTAVSYLDYHYKVTTVQKQWSMFFIRLLRKPFHKNGYLIFSKK